MSNNSAISWQALSRAVIANSRTNVAMKTAKGAPISRAKMTARAVAYAKAGFHVFPVHHMLPDGRCSCGRLPMPKEYRGKYKAKEAKRRFPDRCSSPGKHPATPRGHHDASNDSAQVKAMFAASKGFNIAWNAGADGFAVLDIDPRNGGDATIERLFDEIGKPEGAIVQNSGGGGKHYAARVPDDAPVKGTLGPGIDVKRDGYVVIAPSNHESGRTYSFADENSRDVMLGLQDAPAFPEAYLARMAAGASKSAGRPKSAAEVKEASSREKRLIDMFERADVLAISDTTDLSDQLQDRLAAACEASDAFCETWEQGLDALDTRKQQPGAAFGRVLDDDTIEAITDSRDLTHSGWRMRFANLARFQGFKPIEFAKLCRANEASGLEDLEGWQQLRQLARVWIRTDDHEKPEADKRTDDADNDNTQERVKVARDEFGHVDFLEDLAHTMEDSGQPLIEGLADVGESTTIIADAGVGKTILMAKKAACLITGNDFLGCKVLKAGVLYIAAEDAAGVKARLAASLIQEGWTKDVPAPLRVLGADQFAFDYKDPAQAKKAGAIIAREIAIMKAKFGVEHIVVFFDTLRDLHSAKENDNGEMQHTLKRLVASAGGSSTYIAQHAVKSGEHEAGAGAIKGAVYNSILLRKEGKGVKLTLLKRRHGRSDLAFNLTYAETDIASLLPPAPEGVERRTKYAVFKWREASKGEVFNEVPADDTDDDADEVPMVAKLPKTGTREHQIYNAVKTLTPNGELVTFGRVFAHLLGEKVKRRGKTRLEPLSEKDRRGVRTQINRLSADGHLEKSGNSYRLPSDPQPEFSPADDEV